MSWEMQLDGKLLEDLYKWIDNLSLSRPKRNIERDFSDGVLVAEIIHYYLPELIDLHNYSAANSLEHKKSNWSTLNKKVLSNIGLDLPDVIVAGLSNGKPGLIEVLLYNLRFKIDEQLELEGKAAQQSSRYTSNSFLKTKLNNNLNQISSTRLNDSLNSNKKNVSRVDYEEIKQQYLHQEEEIEALQAKLRRLEHVIQLKDMRINDLLTTLEHDQSHKTAPSKKK